MTVSFGTPEHGWLRVQVATADSSCAKMVSDVPCDSLGLLVDALASMTAGAAREVVEWSLEPGSWRYTFEAIEFGVRFSVTGHDGHVLSARMSETSLLRSFCQGSFRLKGDPVWT